jgi:putative ABC transport system permease protein
MNLGEFIHVSWRNLLRNKSRSLLTMLGVIIGVAAVIVMMAVSAGTEATIAERINGLGSNLIFISANFSRGGPQESAGNQGTGLVYTDVAAIRDNITGVAGVSVEQRADATVKFGNTTLTGISVVGTTPDYTIVRDVSVSDGRFFNETELNQKTKVVILGSSVATDLFGDAEPVGQNILVDNVRLTVIGVLAPKGLVSGTNFDTMIYTPITLVFEKFTPSQFARIIGDRVRTIFVSVDPKYKMDDVIQQITLLLAKRHKVSTDSPDFVIQTQSDIIATQESTTQSFRTLLIWVAGVSLIVGGIGIMNIMLVTVTERTREIGLRQAVGATPTDIQVQFLIEALMLSMVGGVIGVLLGVGGAWLFAKLGSMRIVVIPYSILLSFTSAALVGIIFGYLPARKAAQLDPIVALRHD